MPEITIKPSAAGVFAVVDGVVYLKHMTAAGLRELSEDFAKAAKEREWHDRCQRADDDGAFDVV